MNAVCSSSEVWDRAQLKTPIFTLSLMLKKVKMSKPSQFAMSHHNSFTLNTQKTWIDFKINIWILKLWFQILYWIKSKKKLPTQLDGSNCCFKKSQQISTTSLRPNISAEVSTSCTISVVNLIPPAIWKDFHQITIIMCCRGLCTEMQHRQFKTRQWC